MTERVRRETQAGISGARLGSYFGIEIVAHWSLVIIFALIAVSLAVGAFPQWHPEWPPLLTWGVALVAAALFVLSVALHELSHALVGRTQGTPIERITLFIFGGMAHMRRDPPNPRAELLMAVAGPLTSLIIGLVSTGIGLWLTSGIVERFSEQPQQALATMDPVATLLLWLGPVNILLAVFNMVPGFPLDGGRVLRAILWQITGNLQRATRWAAGMGQAIAWILIGGGVLMVLGYALPIFGRGAINGLWLVLIGWFLNNAARMSYQQVLVRDMLRDVRVRTIMRSNILTAPPDTRLERLVQDYIMTVGQRAFPIVEDNQLQGLVDIDDVRRIPRDDWPNVACADVMTPASDLFALHPDDTAISALEYLSSEPVEQLAVLEDSNVVGLVHREDIMKWMLLQGDMEGRR